MTRAQTWCENTQCARNRQPDELVRDNCLRVLMWRFCAPETEGKLFQTAMSLSKEAFCFKYLQLGAARVIGWARVRSSQDVITPIDVITPNSRMNYSWPSEPPLRWTAKDHSLIRQAQKRSIIRNTCIDWGQHPAFTVVEMCVLTYSYLLEARAKACLLEIWRQEKKKTALP